jgi:hypothetical protein
MSPTLRTSKPPITTAVSNHDATKAEGTRVMRGSR